MGRALDGVDDVIADRARRGEYQRFVYAAQQDAQQTGGETGVVKVVALVHGGHMTGQRGEYESDEDAQQHAHQDPHALGPGVAGAEHHLGYGGGQGTGEKTHVDHAAEGDLFHLGVKERAEQDGDDVQRVFPVEAQAKHQEEGAEGRPADLGPAEFQHRPGDQPHQAHAEKAAAQAAHLIGQHVGDQLFGGGHDRHEPRKGAGAADDHTGRHKYERNAEEEQQKQLPRVFFQ